MSYDRTYKENRINKSLILPRLLLAAVMGSNLLVIGCNSSDSASTTPPTGNTGRQLISACDLLTSAEAAVILGEPVLQMKSDTIKYVTHCTYEGAVSPGAILPSYIDVNVFTTAGLQAHLSPTLTVPAYFADLKNLTPATDQIQLTGIGNDAIWLKRPGKVDFYKADVHVSAQFSPNGKIVDTSVVALEGCKNVALYVAAKI